jgi:hypothetical protein
MHARAERRTQRLEQSPVAEPTVRDHQDRRLGKDLGQVADEPDRLGELGLKDHRLAAHADAPHRQGLEPNIEGEGQRQAAPAPMDPLEQAHRHNGLRPRVLALVGLGGVVEGR